MAYLLDCLERGSLLLDKGVVAHSFICAVNRFWKFGFYLMAALSLLMAGVLVGRSCESRGAPPVLSEKVPITLEEFLRTQGDIAALRKLIESRFGKQETIIRTIIVRDTVYGQGLGQQTSHEFTYQDQRLWFWVNLVNDSVQYAISPVRIGLVLSREGNVVRSVAYDLDDSTALAMDSVQWDEAMPPFFAPSLAVGCYYPWEPFGRAELEFRGRLGVVAETSWREGLLARAGLYWRF
jgi:hypothetical protein